MVLYDIKKGWYKNIDGPGLEMLMKEAFGNVEMKGSRFVSSYGVLKEINVEMIDKGNLRVDTVNKAEIKSDEEILDTKRKLNAFVEKATGFDAKARMKRAQQKAKKGEL